MQIALQYRSTDVPGSDYAAKIDLICRIRTGGHRRWKRETVGFQVSGFIGGVYECLVRFDVLMRGSTVGERGVGDQEHVTERREESKRQVR